MSYVNFWRSRCVWAKFSGSWKGAKEEERRRLKSGGKKQQWGGGRDLFFDFGAEGIGLQGRESHGSSVLSF